MTQRRRKNLNALIVEIIFTRVKDLEVIALKIVTNTMLNKKTKIMKSNKTLIRIALLIAALFLFTSCDKEDDCDCIKKTYHENTGSDIKEIEIEFVQCVGDLDGWGGRDENGNWFMVECK